MPQLLRHPLWSYTCILVLLISCTVRAVLPLLAHLNYCQQIDSRCTGVLIAIINESRSIVLIVIHASVTTQSSNNTFL